MAEKYSGSHASNDEGYIEPRRKRPSTPVRILLVLAVVIIAACILVYGTGLILTHGPSEELKNLFVRTFNDTGTLQSVPSLFLSEEEIDEIIHPVAVVLEHIEYEPADEADGATPVAEYDSMIEVFEVAGGNWKGKMMLIHDPNLITLAIPETYGNDEAFTVDEFVSMNGAIGGTTAGGYVRNSKKPTGYVIKDGQIVSSVDEKKHTFVGFDADRKLWCKSWTAEDAIENGMVEGISWSPCLIRNGKVRSNLGGGLNPRAAIGQTSDGTVVLVVIEGRQLGSFGCTYDELAELMFSYGCITACNLDSGRSAVMVYNNEQITSYALGRDILNGERTLPNAWIIIPEGSNG